MTEPTIRPGSALAIPDPLATAVPDGWGLDLMDVADRLSDLHQLDDGRAELAGFVAAYRKKGADAKELRIGERCVEIRIGELLGPPPPHGGPRTEAASSDQNLPEGFNKARASEFRKLAANREDVLTWIKGGTIGRAALLARIDARDAGYGLTALDGLPRCPVVYADPPWQYEHEVTETRAIENQYTTMTNDAIASLGGEEGRNIPAADQSVLFLWTTNALQHGLDVMAAWGFRYRTNMAWVKDRIGLGYYVRGQHELLLIGERGGLPTPDAANRPPSVVAAPRGEHSAKPEVFYEIIEQMYPGMPKVELFARQARDGWHSWGHGMNGDPE